MDPTIGFLMLGFWLLLCWGLGLIYWLQARDRNKKKKEKEAALKRYRDFLRKRTLRRVK
jgi:hypothetical protein